ncbi:MAG: pyridoxal phosphate-dependent aminotransferase [Lentisphaeria bacterium]|nr:pyridoxal phosphate-dependent aminotransferase [Lentisphaeria bacterium]
MQTVTDEIKGFLANSSGIRKMFEAGIELKKQFGEDNVYDFSLGNPDLPPPPQVGEALSRIAKGASEPFAIGYMPNAGYPRLRAMLASKLSEEQGKKLSADHVVMTVGAAGGLNAVFRAILARGDEVLTPSPYFVEYGSYAGNFGGVLRPVPSRDFSFELDVQALAAAVNEKTRAIILNSPHNPTGQIYSAADLAALGKVVSEAEKRYGKPVFVLADEPYRFLNYDNTEIPSVFRYFEHALVVGSFSKTLSLAGERIGYVAANPDMENVDELMNALILCVRILGYVNAPAIGQKILMDCLDAKVDLDIYRARRSAMAKVLSEAGIAFTMPKGAFYFFPQSPVKDEKVFIDALLKEHILVVPGTSFGCPGYFRTTFCVSEKVILGSAEGFKRAVQAVK